jgi:hypothetical protein
MAAKRGATTGEAKGSGGRRRRARQRHLQSYAWLGAGAITLGVGAALGSGSGVAHADAAGTGKSSSSHTSNATSTRGTSSVASNVSRTQRQPSTGASLVASARSTSIAISTGTALGRPETATAGTSGIAITAPQRTRIGRAKPPTVSSTPVAGLAAAVNPPDASGATNSTAPPDPAGTTIGLVMGGSGLPLPNSDIPGYVGLADQFYIHPNFPGTTYPDPYANGLFTPEYPLLSRGPLPLNYPTAKSGPLAGFPALNTSVGQGMLILENAIASNMAAGNASTVFGWSQSATISGLVMQQLDPTGQPMPNQGLQFVLIGDPNAPNGGVFERFDGLNVPSINMSFDGATPANSFPTDIYTLEYDGIADFPKYPINFLADLNATLGYSAIHGLYLTPGVISSTVLDQAVLLPGSKALGADTQTNYYMIPLSALPSPVNYLPLVQPLLGIPVVGKPLADLLQPDLTVLVNLGYGADNLGYSTPANVPTPFGLFPNVNPATVFHELVTGAQQGFNAFVTDLQNLSLSSLVPATSSSSPTSLRDRLRAMSTAASNPSATLTDIVNAISSAASSLYTELLPTANLINAALTTLPAYDVSLFLNNLSNPINAIGLPIAADTGLLTLGAVLDLALWAEGITAAINDIAAVIP